MFSSLESCLDDAPRLIYVSLVSLTRERRIAAGEGVRDGFVLALGGERAVGFYPPTAPKQIHVRPERRQMLLEKRVPRTTGLKKMELVIPQQDLFAVSNLDPRARCYQQITNGAEFDVRRPSRGQFAGDTFRNPAHLVRLSGFVIRWASNETTAVGVAHHQTLLLQALDRLPDGCATHLEALGQRSLNKPFTGAEMASDDRRSEATVDLVEHAAAAADGEWIFSLTEPNRSP